MPHFDINSVTHPSHTADEADWNKWRITYEAGDDFIDEYLTKFSSREDADDFAARKKITYVPAFAAAAVDEVKDAIFQRISDVSRAGGADSYNDAVDGLKGGVDLTGTSMNSFVGRTLLPELTVMGRVGVFVDMPKLDGTSLSAQQGKHPYIYTYTRENIINWDRDPTTGIYRTLLLRDWDFGFNEEFNLPNITEASYRLLKLTGDGRVHVQFYDNAFQPTKESFIDLPEIPFVNFELDHSLMVNIANYQIALLNLSSSDISYALKSNFPFYVEPYDPRHDGLYGRPAGNTIPQPGDVSINVVSGGERNDAIAGKTDEIRVGAVSGRRIPVGLGMPQYIAPPTDPLLASMKKQEELKKDIRMLVKLSTANLSSTMASGESKGFDERSLDAGLSAIGLELEHGERQVAKYWQWYEDKNGDIPTVSYPLKYSLQSSEDTRQRAQELQKSTQGHPSITYKKEVYKINANALVGHNVSRQTLDIINKEIDSADVLVSEPEELRRDVELGAIDLEAASKAKGYPAGSVEKAAVEHAARVARIAESQMKARGTADLGGIANSSRDEVKELDETEAGSVKTRGNADDTTTD